MNENATLKTKREIKVGNNTARYIDLVARLEVFWSDVVDIVVGDYGESNTIIDEKFYPHLSNIKKGLYELLQDSIDENIKAESDTITI